MCTPQRTVKPSCHRAVYIVRAICFERAVGNLLTLLVVTHVSSSLDSSVFGQMTRSCRKIKDIEQILQKYEFR